MPAFEYRQAEEVRDALARHGVRYLFIGKSGAILLGFPDTTQDADLFANNAASDIRAGQPAAEARLARLSLPDNVKQRLLSRP
jgi:hypothetical protein